MNPTHVALYDDQCEICQTFGTWLRLLDDEGAVRLQPIDPAALSALHPDLRLDEVLKNLHVVCLEDGRLLSGAPALAELAGLFGATRWLGAAARLPLLDRAAARLYRAIADNRYALSKCRGGACRPARLDCEREGALGAFWSCYTFSMLLRLPLAGWSYARRLALNVVEHFSTRGRRISLLNGRLTLNFLDGWPYSVVPLLFGERFAYLRYGPLAVDPGAPRMRASLERHLDAEATRATAVLATHKHEEHVGNADWLAARLGAPLKASAATATHLRRPQPLPALRALILGQPQPVTSAIEELPERLVVGDECFEIYPAPGHCDDHVVVYDRAHKVLLAGDAFMGVYFSTPNPDVDSTRWVETLERILALDIELLVEGHGHVHTLREDVPEVVGVVVREDPKAALRAKLDFFRFLRDQIKAGLSEGLPIRAIEATCFPWHQPWSWERLANDELTRVLTLGEFSRTELIRSFLRSPSRPEPITYRVSALMRP